MKRKFLEDMGLSKEQVDSIMDENGRDIEAMKSERVIISLSLRQPRRL